MITDVFELICEYKQEIERLENLLSTLNERYGSIVDLKFTRLEHALNFCDLLDEELGTGFITFDGRCSLCHNSSVELWSYTESEVLTMGLLLEFCLYLKTQGKLCEHERVDTVSVSNILICCHLVNESGTTIQDVET